MIRIHHDEPTVFDQLERIAFVKSLGEAIALSPPPLVIGVHGDWGSGKTSLMRQLWLVLSGECARHDVEEVTRARELFGVACGHYRDDVCVVWFDAWKYQQEPTPIVALLQEMRTQIPRSARWLAEGGKLLEVAITSALIAFEGITKKIGIQTSTIRTEGERWEKEHLATALPANTTRDALEHTLRTILGRKDDHSAAYRRVVVLVDDLDRCEPSVAVQLLEGIKMYLDLPSCVFVLGMNHRAIEEAFESKDKTRNPQRAREYLEKICHDIWHVPALPAPDRLVGQWLSDEDHSKEIAVCIRDYACLPANPRKIKAFCNVIRRFLGRKQLDTTDLQRSVQLLVAISCLYQFHPELYRVLEHDGRFINRITAWAKGEITANHPLLDVLERTEGPIAPQDERAPLPIPTLGPLFPDPVRGNVLRAQRLLADLAPITTDEVDRHSIFST